MTNDRVIDRVRKLLALARDAAATEGERDNAMRMAYNTLAKYNLSISDVGDGTAAQEKREEQRATLSVYPWARSIAHTIADLFFCNYYFQRGAGKLATHTFIGRQSNAITANEMAQYVVSSVFKELRQRYGSETSPEARSFATGVEAKLRERVRQLKRDAAAEATAATPGTSLVLVDLYASEALANEAWLKAQGVKLKAGANRTKGTGDVSAYAAGKDYGAKVALNTQLGASRSSVLRIK